MYAPEFYVELGGDNQLGLKTHYHTIQVVNGKIQLGQPTSTKPDPFDLGDVVDSLKAVRIGTRDYKKIGNAWYVPIKSTAYKAGGQSSAYEIASGNTDVNVNDVYNLGYDDGESGVSLSSLENGQQQYYPDYGAYLVRVDYSLSNGRSGSQNIRVDASGGGGYVNYVYSTSSAWTSRNNHPVCRVTTIVYGVTSGGSYVQLASGTDDYERPY
jgi:hypothetical protein